MNKTIKKVLNELIINGYEAYLVGGYCRDLYMGKESTDYDICTNAKPKEIKEIFNKNIVPSESYGCVTLFVDKKRFEITTYRKDINYFNNRFPVSLKYVKKLKIDLNRRDFIMNTLCMDINGNYIDLLGARQDIDNKIIRVVGDTDKKIKEDSLRILRAVRFATTLDFELDNKLKESIIDNAHLVKKLSYERKKKELDKIFSSSNKEKGIKLLKELKLDKYLDIDLKNVKHCTHIIGYWAQIDNGKYQFNKTEKEQIDKIKELLKLNFLDNTNLYKYGLYLCTIVGEMNGVDKSLILNKYENLLIHDRQEIEIEPLEICDILNKDPGSFLKNIIIDIENKLINNEIDNDKELLKQYILEEYKEK